MVTCSNAIPLIVVSSGPAQIVGVPLAAFSAAKGVFGWASNQFTDQYSHATKQSNICLKKLLEIQDIEDELNALKESNESPEKIAPKLEALVVRMKNIREFANRELVSTDSQTPIKNFHNIRSNCLSDPRNAFKETVNNSTPLRERIRGVFDNMEKTISSTRSSLLDQKRSFDRKRYDPAQDFANALFYTIAMLPGGGTVLATMLIPSFWDN